MVYFGHFDSTGGWSSLSIGRSRIHGLIADLTKCVSERRRRAKRPMRTGAWFAPVMHEWMLFPTVLTPIVVAGGNLRKVSTSLIARYHTNVEKYPVSFTEGAGNLPTVIK